MNIGQMRCPKCGHVGPTIPGPCPCCGHSGAQTQKIYKYKLNGSVKQIIELPYGAKLLRTAIVQNGTICLYAMVDTDPIKTAKIEIGVLGTGWEIPSDRVYWPENHLASVQDGDFVWHIFANPIYI